MDTLKDYAIKALVNTVDHLGSVTYKVNDLLDEKVDEVSGTELRLSCIEQVFSCFFITQLVIQKFNWIISQKKIMAELEKILDRI